MFDNEDLSKVCDWALKELTLLTDERCIHKYFDHHTNECLKKKIYWINKKASYQILCVRKEILAVTVPPWVRMHQKKKKLRFFQQDIIKVYCAHKGAPFRRAFFVCFIHFYLPVHISITYILHTQYVLQPRQWLHSYEHHTVYTVRCAHNCNRNMVMGNKRMR